MRIKKIALAKSEYYKNFFCQRFGKLVILNIGAQRLNGVVCLESQCDCGNRYFVAVKRLNNGTAKSCGCLKYASKYQKNEVKKDYSYIENGSTVRRIVMRNQKSEFNKKNKQTPPNCSVLCSIFI